MNILNKLSRIATGWVLFLICISSFGLMFWASQTDSAIVDELAHIPAGYGYVHNLDYRLNPEHPPLLKALAAFPVLFLNPIFPTGSDAWQKQINAQWDMGSQFLYQSGNDANAIIRTARIFPIILTILAIILVYFLARRIMGDRWALVPAFLFAFDPTVLAHGHYVTTDLAATFGVLFAIFFFLKFIETPRTRNLWLAGIAFGTAMVLKFSTPLLVPLFIFLLFVLWVREMARTWNEYRGHRIRRYVRSGLRHVWHLIAIGAIGYIVVVYPIYGLFTLHYPIGRQVADTTAILMSFPGGPTPAGQMCHGVRCLADLTITMAGNPILRPLAEYMLGMLMVLQRSGGLNTIYFMGHVVGSGGPLYFPLVYLLKEPIPTLLIVLIAFVLALTWTIKKMIVNTTIKKDWHAFMHYLDTNFTQFSLASFIVLYWIYSMHSPLNIGLRHVLPTLPLIAILAAWVWRKWIMSFNISAMALDANSMAAFAANAMRMIAKRAAKYAALILLLFWLLIETLIAAPQFLSYFNEFAGGTPNGYRFVDDSNYDWGQDLLRMQTWMKQASRPCDVVPSGEPCGVDKIAIDYFGGGDIAYTLGRDAVVKWDSSKPNPVTQNIHWIAISINFLEISTQPLGPGQERNPNNTYEWLRNLRPATSGMGSVPSPDYRIGSSIFVYHL